jgi:hypothetical protein
MPIYVVVTDQRVVAAIEAPTQREAEQYADSTGFQFTLTFLIRAGKPLWDGKAELAVRPATEKEQARWPAASRAGHNGHEVINALVPFCDD